MKYISFFLLFFLLFLTSCGSSGSSDTKLSTLKKDGFSIAVPANWSENSDSFPTPKTGEVVLAISADTSTNDYKNNLIILKIDSTLWESSKALMENTKIGLKSQLTSFSLQKESSINFSDSDEWIILAYNAQYSNNTPELFYIQTAKHCTDANYFLTLSLPEQPENLERYIELLATFACN